MDWNIFAAIHCRLVCVTPCVGVWIEISRLSVSFCSTIVSLPAWECGLKSVMLTPTIRQLSHSLRGSVDWNCPHTTYTRWSEKVTPCVGVWIEIFQTVPYLGTDGSLPAWECGLKYRSTWYYKQTIWVTPCVGVWIEITLWMARQTGHCCHSLRGSVDWNYEPTHAVVSNPLVTPCVGVWIEIKT